MSDDANFTLRLINEVSRPAKQMQASLRQVQSSFKELDTFSRMAKSAMRDMHRDHAVEAVRSSQKQLKASAELTRGLQQMKADQSSAALEAFSGGALKAGLVGVGVAATAAAVAVGVLAARFGGAAIQAANFAQRSTMALELLTGSGTVAAREFGLVRNEAAALGLDVQGTVRTFQKLLAAQFEIGKAKELIRMGSDLQAIGATSEEVSRAMLAITQIKSKGRLQAEEMLQLQEAGISAELVYKALGDRLGKTGDELRKMQLKGEIGAEVGLAAIMEAVGKKTGAKKAGDAGKKFATGTLEGMSNVLKGNIANVFVDIGQAIEPTLVALGARVPQMFENIMANPAVASLGRFLLAEFELFGLWVDANWPEIEATVISAVETVAASIRGAVEVVRFFTDYWSELKVVLYGVAAVVGLVVAGGLLLLAPFLLVGAAVVALVGAFASLVGYVASNFGKVVDVVSGALLGVLGVVGNMPLLMLTLGVNLVQGLINGIGSMGGAAVQAAMGLANRVLQGFKNALGIASPSKVFEQFGVFSGEGFALGIEGSAQRVTGASTGLAGAAVAPVAASASSGSRAVSGFGDVHLHVTAAPGATREDAERFGESLVPIIRRELLSLFEGEALGAAY